MGLKLSDYRPAGVQAIDLGQGAQIEHKRLKIADRVELANFLQWLGETVQAGIAGGDLDAACAKAADEFVGRFGGLFVGCSGLLGDDGTELSLAEALPLVGRDPDLLTEVIMLALRGATVSAGEGNG